MRTAGQARPEYQPSSDQLFTAGASNLHGPGCGQPDRVPAFDYIDYTGGITGHHSGMSPAQRNPNGELPHEATDRVAAQTGARTT